MRVRTYPVRPIGPVTGRPVARTSNARSDSVKARSFLGREQSRWVIGAPRQSPAGFQIACLQIRCYHSFPVICNERHSRLARAPCRHQRRWADALPVRPGVAPGRRAEPAAADFGYYPTQRFTDPDRCKRPGSDAHPSVNRRFSKLAKHRHEHPFDNDVAAHECSGRGNHKTFLPRKVERCVHALRLVG